MRTFLITGRSRIATISMCCQRHSSAIDAAKSCDAVDDTEGRVRELLAAPASPAKNFVVRVLGQKNVVK